MPKTETPPVYPLVQFRSQEPLTAALSSRTDGDGIQHTARRDLERYYALLERERRVVLGGLLSAPELCLICDALSGTRIDATSIQHLASEIAEAAEIDGLAAKWDVDGAGLVDRLRSLRPGATWALVDASERWRLTGTEADVSGFMRVGLVPSEGRA